MKRFFLSSLLLFVLVELVSQRPSTCTTVMPPISSCSAACIHCNLDGYTSRTNRFDNTGVPPAGFCTMIVHHIQYVGFVAGSPSLTIQVDVLACMAGPAIELGIYETEDCSSYNLVSNCNTFMPPGTYIFTTNTTLNVGCPYYLVIDGNLPSDCDFTVRVIGGSTVAPPVTFNGPIIGPDHVCEGEEAVFSVSHNGACYRQWSVDNGIIIGDDMEDEVTIEFTTPGVARVCFTGENLCNPEAELCKDVRVHPNPIEVLLGPFEICENEFYNYNGTLYPGGTHEINHQTIYGCDSIEVLEIIEIEEYHDRLNVSVCFPDCYSRGGQTFCIPGYHRVVIPSHLPPFCDTVYDLTLNSIRIEPRLVSSGNLSCGDTLVTISGDSSLITGTGRVSYLWTDPFGDEIGDQSTVQVTEPGRYCFEITVEGPDGTICTDQICTEVVEIIDPPELALDTSVLICRGDTLFIVDVPVYEINGYQGKITIHSGIPDTTNIIKDYIIIDDTTSLWAFFSAGRCNDDLGFMISPSPSPDILVRDTLSLCEGDTVTLASIAITNINGVKGMISFHSGFPTDSANLLFDPIIADSLLKIYVRSELDECADVERVSLNVLPIPQGGFIFSDDTICVGDTVDIVFTGDLDNSFTYLWDWMGATVISKGGEDYSIYWSNSGSYTISLEVDNGTCLSPLTSATIVVEQPLEPLILECDQNDTVITFSWNTLIGASQYNVREISTIGQGSRLNDTTYRITGLANGDTVEIEVTGIGPESCGPVTARLQCKAIYCPPKEFDIDSVGFICLDANSSVIRLSATIEGGFGGGEKFWEGPGIIDSLTGDFDPRIAGLGTHLVTCVFEKDDCLWRTTTIIEIRPTPIASFTVDSVICMDSSATLIFTGMASSTGMATWSFDGGFALPGPGTFDRTISWTTSGEKLLSLIISENGCTSEVFSGQVRVEPPLDSLILNCDATKTSLSISFTKVANARQYDINVLSGQVVNILEDTIISIDNLVPGEEVIVEITVISDNACADLVQTIRCSALDCPELLFEMDDEFAFCDKDRSSTFEIPFDLPGSSDQGTFTWTGSELSDIRLGILFLDRLDLGSHKYIVEYTEDGCSYKDSVLIIINSTPEIDAGSDLLLTCTDTVLHAIVLHSGDVISWQPAPFRSSNDTFYFNTPGDYSVTAVDTITGCNAIDRLMVRQVEDVPVDLIIEVEAVGCDSSDIYGSFLIDQVIGGTAPYTYSTDGVNFSSDPSFVNLTPGTYQIWVKDVYGCIIRETVEIEKADVLTVDLGPNLEIFHGEIVNLEALTNRNVEVVQWLPDDLLSCTDCLLPSLRPDSTILLTIIVTDENGCQASDEILIRVKYKRVFIPNTFSPNGDLLNDRLTIFGSEEVQEIVQYRVYDRWGELMYQVENVSLADHLGWDGTFNGELMNPGVYVLMSRLLYTDGSTEDFITDVTLVH